MVDLTVNFWSWLYNADQLNFFCHLSSVELSSWFNCDNLKGKKTEDKKWLRAFWFWVTLILLSEKHPIDDKKYADRAEIYSNFCYSMRVKFVFLYFLPIHGSIENKISNLSNFIWLDQILLHLIKFPWSIMLLVFDFWEFTYNPLIIEYLFLGIFIIMIIYIPDFVLKTQI